MNTVTYTNSDQMIELMNNIISAGNPAAVTASISQYNPINPVVTLSLDDVQVKLSYYRDDKNHLNLQYAVTRINQLGFPLWNKSTVKFSDFSSAPYKRN